MAVVTPVFGILLPYGPYAMIDGYTDTYPENAAIVGTIFGNTSFVAITGLFVFLGLKNSYWDIHPLVRRSSNPRYTYVCLHVLTRPSIAPSIAWIQVQKPREMYGEPAFYTPSHIVCEPYEAVDTCEYYSFLHFVTS